MRRKEQLSRSGKLGFAKACEVSQKNRQCRDWKRCVQARRECWQRGVYEGAVRGQVSIISGGLEAGCGSPFHATGGVVQPGTLSWDERSCWGRIGASQARIGQQQVDDCSSLSERRRSWILREEVRLARWPESEESLIQPIRRDMAPAHE